MLKTVFKNVMLRGNLTDITVQNGKIISTDKTTEKGDYDFKGNRIYPGLIDIHTHGCIGLDVTNDIGCLEKISDYQAKLGVTCWYPTTNTYEFNHLIEVTKQKITGLKGAHIPGFHMEGPYISEKKLGAMNKEYLRKPDITELENFKNVKMLTVAPEIQGAMEFIKNCKAIISIGHTVCDYETAVLAAECGAKCVTHVFNAMPPFLHREPSVVGAAIDKDLFVQVICDGIHIHSSVIKALYRIFGSDRLILISDSVAAAGMPDGGLMFGGQKVVIKNGIVRTLSGALAGSTANLYHCVKKAIEFGISPDEAFKMATETPAKLMGLNKGVIAVGFDADFIEVDSKFNLLNTYILGEKYSK